MAKIRVRIDEAVDAIYPAVVSMKVEAKTASGRRIVFEPRDPLGHCNNPMQDKDVNAKFLTAAETVLGKSRASQALERWRDLENLTDLSDALDLLNVSYSDGIK